MAFRVKYIQLINALEALHHRVLSFRHGGTFTCRAVLIGHGGYKYDESCPGERHIFDT